MTPNAKYGYIITATRGLIADGYTPLSEVSPNGDYSYACADADTGVNMAIYPSYDAAYSALLRAAKGSDPLVYDGLAIRSLGEACHHNGMTAQCVAFGYVVYPNGAPVVKFD